ncbi:hypothetical protein [Sulfurimonas sp.]|uniref:hypothetical protein n=1 Tax=Sulfurimonas sp. TaxID=2022749 RepID=UPI0025FA5709|nr:hypothetical protein [Sulfurimonas sp.]MBW6488796.1 hypothetical protein [Sulfurimonas sp.]
MELFLELEGAYIVIAVFILVVTAIVTTRDFVPKGAFKKGMISVVVMVSLMIAFHYNMTTSRMEEVQALFTAGETVICENKMRRTASRSVLISQKMGWKLEDNLFKNSDYERDFHTSRCVEWIGVEPDIEEKKQ